MSDIMTIPARRDGKTLAADERLQIALLNLLFDAIEPVSVSALAAVLRCTRRDLFCAIRLQALAGNIKKGEPIALTSSCRFAIAAGRMATTDWREAA